ncbi:cytoplasmic protein [Phormidium tenue FACHB-886]|nr:cytoplasmic protein [Phormidium tenue FACHB-886]
MMAHVLIVGESWITNATHFKGFDQFNSTTYESGVAPLKQAIENAGHEVQWMPSHEAQSNFPQQIEGLTNIDVLILSDVGANTLLLHPDTWLRGKPTPNRLKLIRDWTLNGGALIMCGGYYSFQGMNAGAFYHRTPVETVLPVNISPYDDRVEVPEGGEVKVLNSNHSIVAGIDTNWEILLGYNRVEAKPNATVLATINDEPLLVVGEFGQGRSIAWTSDIGPHWCPEVFTNWYGYNQLWKQAIDWLLQR